MLETLSFSTSESHKAKLFVITWSPDKQKSKSVKKYLQVIGEKSKMLQKLQIPSTFFDWW